ncbi:MAG TPA: YhjD/YihY/BrkB family envelope integrity protein [Verrucomicrobiae bacterium]|nr:YhjD/YihY/BrkB family envelope integrity protein [Verrucomicrobiae bacterium]
MTGTSTGEGEELLQLEGKLERLAHFWTLVIRHFVRNRCLIRASALAYTSLLAMIPLLAVVISISTSLLKNADEDKFYQAIASIAPPTALPVTPAATNSAANSNFTDDESAPAGTSAGTNAIATASTLESQTTVRKELAGELQKFVKNTQGASLGVTGLVAFVLIAITMLSRIEETFNDIWGVPRGRGWLTRVVLYWTAITLGPILLLIAISLAGGSQVQAVKDYFQQMPGLGNFILKLLPLLVLWLTFALIYQIVPNTKVQFPAALVGGMVAGTLWHANNLFGFIYVSRTIQNSQMYGKLALVPVFMLGLYFSWAILLFGAQVAYAFQNRAAYLQDKLAENVNQRGREFVALRIMTLIGQRFQTGLKPASVLQLATELGVPSRLTQQILRTLACAHLVTEVGGTEAGYVPARPLDTINAHHILLALRCGSGRELPMAELPALAEIYGEFARIEDAERMAAEKISLLTLATREPVRPAIDAPKDCAVENQIAQIADTLVVEEISQPGQSAETASPKKPAARHGTGKPKKHH